MHNELYNLSYGVVDCKASYMVSVLGCVLTPK